MSKKETVEEFLARGGEVEKVPYKSLGLKLSYEETEAEVQNLRKDKSAEKRPRGRPPRRIQPPKIERTAVIPGFVQLEVCSECIEIATHPECREANIRERARRLHLS